MHFNCAILIALAATSLATSCASAEPSDEAGYVLPPPDSSLDPARLHPGASAYDCGQWAPSVDTTVPFLLLDARIQAPSDSLGFTPDYYAIRSAVHRAGGAVLAEYHLSILRLWVRLRTVEDLYTRGLLYYAVTVPDPARYDWDVIVGYGRAPTATDSLGFVHHGGRVLGKSSRSLRGILPNQSIPAISADSAVRYLESNDHGCFVIRAG